MIFDDSFLDIDGLINRYEQSLKEGRPGYFDVDELEEISDFYHSIGKEKESVEVIDLGLKLHPDNSVLLIRRATLYADVGNYARALKIIEKVPEKNDVDVRLLKAEIYLNSQRKLEGMMILNQLIKESSSDIVTIAIDISSILSEMSMHRESLKFLEYALKHSPDNIALLEEIAFCYEQSNDLQNAIMHYKKILDLNPYYNEVWFNLGQLYFNSGDFVNASEAYEFALAINPDDYIAMLQYAHSLFNSERYKEAVKVYNEIYLIDANDAISVFEGEAYEKAGLFDDAIRCYQQAFELNENNIDACNHLALCFMEKDDHKSSFYWIDRALKINDTHYETWTNLGDLLILMDLKDEAIITYNKSLTIKGDQPDALVPLGNLCFDDNQFEKALDYYLLAYSIDENYPGINLFLALSYSKTGNLDLADFFLKKAIVADQNAERLFNELNS